MHIGTVRNNTCHYSTNESYLYWINSESLESTAMYFSHGLVQRFFSAKNVTPKIALSQSSQIDHMKRQVADRTSRLFTCMFTNKKSCRQNFLNELYFFGTMFNHWWYILFHWWDNCPTSHTVKNALTQHTEMLKETLATLLCEIFLLHSLLQVYQIVLTDCKPSECTYYYI